MSVLYKIYSRQIFWWNIREILILGGIELKVFDAYGQMDTRSNSNPLNYDG